MSEYRFTGPFYNDNEEPVYGTDSQEEGAQSTAYQSSYQSSFTEPVTPPPVEKPKKKKGGFLKTAVKTICIAVLAGAVGGGAFLGVLYVGHDVMGIGKTEQTITEIQKAQPSQTISSTVNNSIDVSSVVEKCTPSVVSITNKGVQEIRSWFGTYEQETSGSGSGIIIGENDTELLIVTNYHVVSDSKELSVYFSFEEQDDDESHVISAKIKGYDSQKDLAVISVKLSDIPNDVKSQIVIATVGDSSALKVGEQVVAIGNALGYGQSTTTGIVSALDRKVSVTGTNGETITNQLIQTDAAINPGNSGGPLINMNGEVIGINSVKLSSEEVEGMGYAIPISAVEEIIGDLMNKVTRDKVEEDEKGYLGIECLSVTSDVAETYGLPMGCYVKSVVKGSAAEAAGIRSGDVIVKLDGSSIASDTELIEALSYYKAGETVNIVVKTRESGYEEQVYSVTFGSKKDAKR